MTEGIPVVCPNCKWSWKTKGKRIKIMCPNCKKDHERTELITEATVKIIVDYTIKKEEKERDDKPIWKRMKQ